MKPTFQADSAPKSVFAVTGVEWSCWRDTEYGGGGLSLTAARPASHKPRLNAEEDWIYSPRQWFKRAGAATRHAWTWVRAPSLQNSLPPPPPPPSTQPPAPEESGKKKKKVKPLRRACVKQAKLVLTPACPGCKRCWQEKHRVSPSFVQSMLVRDSVSRENHIYSRFVEVEIST